MMPKAPYYKASIEGLGIEVRAESYEDLREKLLKEVERKRERGQREGRDLDTVYSDLLRVSRGASDAVLREAREL